MSPEEHELLKQVSHEIEKALEGYTTIEKALILVKCLRQECGDTWVIDMKANGGFTVERREPI